MDFGYCVGYLCVTIVFLFPTKPANLRQTLVIIQALSLPVLSYKVRHCIKCMEYIKECIKTKYAL
jgi:hypothetical protein